MKEVTGAGYDRIRNGFINDTNIDQSILPTLHHLNKSGPLFNFVGSPAGGYCSATALSKLCNNSLIVVETWFVQIKTGLTNKLTLSFLFV